MTGSAELTVDLGRLSPEVLELRARILRAGLDPSTAHFSGDDDPLAIHALARLGTRVVGAGSLLPEPLDGVPGYRVRGMAVEQAYRGRGVGTSILLRLLQVVHEATGTQEESATSRSTSVTPVWCHARVAARSLYERHGFEVVGEVFVIEGIGPHVLMVQRRA
ncbi:MAG: GNAT family N-acetyltransferase [Ferrimicrobium sp.]